MIAKVLGSVRTAPPVLATGVGTGFPNDQGRCLRQTPRGGVEQRLQLKFSRSKRDRSDGGCKMGWNLVPVVVGKVVAVLVE